MKYILRRLHKLEAEGTRQVALSKTWNDGVGEELMRRVRWAKEMAVKATGQPFAPPLPPIPPEELRRMTIVEILNWRLTVRRRAEAAERASQTEPTI